MARQLIHLRYGDSDVECNAWVDEELPAAQAIQPHVREAVDRGIWPENFVFESFQILHDGKSINPATPIKREIEKNGTKPWVLVDANAPQQIQVVARVDSQKGRRALIRSFTFNPQRSQTLKQTFDVSSLLAQDSFGGWKPKRWWVRSAWPARAWLPWGRWSRKIEKFRPGEILELVPHPREWRCYRREWLFALLALFATAAVIAGGWLLSTRVVTFERATIERTAVAGKRTFAIPARQPVRIRLPRWSPLIVLPNQYPIAVYRHVPANVPAPLGAALVRVSIQCWGAAGIDGAWCPGARVSINGHAIGSLSQPIDLDLPVGSYALQVSCAKWDLTQLPTGVSVSTWRPEGDALPAILPEVKEPLARAQILTFVVPPENIGDDHIAALTIYCREQ